MNFKFRDQSHYFEPTQQTNAEVIRQVQQIALNNQLDIHHILVDSMPYYGDLREALEQAGPSSEVRVVERGSSEWLDDLLQSASHYLSAALEQLPAIAASFQQGEEAIQWGLFKELIEGIGWLEEVSSLIINSSFQKASASFAGQSVELNRVIKELLASIEDHDRTLTGDIINYELAELYQQLRDNIATLQTEGIQ
ncbi:hypothetical protein [Cohnella sp. JJ-181]|uniref:hypothetical protein n=1 Tax=Cohnella rhizoplanae TaxID=2974897 RepID=UPI0022FFB0F4|nr:hypothetical protein [Cohnella sp. JJ-181]CAI6084345.1 hypothetical protein COHCIP112018_04307 [Cohnella sp. JJ-181]